MNVLVNIVGITWTVRLINVSAFLLDTTKKSFNFGMRVTNTLLHFIDGTSNTWVFFRDNIGPIPASLVNGYANSPDISWEYNLNLNSIVCRNIENIEDYDIDSVLISRSMPWLSAQIMFTGGSYNIDSFISNFSVNSPQHINPTPKLIANCWSLNSGAWLLPSQNPSLEIIDNNGNTQLFNIYDRTQGDSDRWLALYNDAEESLEEESSEEESPEEESSEEESPEEESPEEESPIETPEESSKDIKMSSDESSESGDNGDIDSDMEIDECFVKLPDDTVEST
jgi:hypothetical protein